MKANEIHLWNGSIGAGRGCFLELYASLSEDEIEKADRFRFDKDRRSYIICRGLLRSILAGYLGLRPAEIRFQYGREGKPFLQNCALCFSVSHSEDRVLYAFCSDHEVGVDLECIRELHDIEELARRCLCPSEYVEFCDGAPAARTTSFLTCWTSKEAYIKATGEGLSRTLDSFRVSAVDSEPTRLSVVLGPQEQASGWNLRHLDPAPGYVGALATRLKAPSLLHWTFASAEECQESADRFSTRISVINA